MPKFTDKITFANIFKIFKFLNVVDDRSGELSPAKVLAWAISIGICVIMFKINDEQLDLTVFAGALMTLITAFGITYKLGQGKKVKFQIEEDLLAEEKDDEVKP